MMHLPTGVTQAVSLALGALLVTPMLPDRAHAQGNKKPSLSLKATPAIVFAPGRVVMTADVRGGSNDFEDFYCANVEWEWGDDTRSTAETDCEPYVAGKSEIKRRYTIEHRYQIAGNYRVAFRLKKGDRVVGSTTANVQVRPGLGQ